MSYHRFDMDDILVIFPDLVQTRQARNIDHSVQFRPFSVPDLNHQVGTASDNLGLSFSCFQGCRQGLDTFRYYVVFPHICSKI